MKLYLLTIGVAAALAVPTAAAASTHGVAAAGQAAPRSASAALTANCEPDPDACGYPDSENSGVSPTAQLSQVPNQVSSGTGWHFDSRGWVVVNGNGANLSDLLIPYPVSITASNVTLDNDEIANGIVPAGPHGSARRLAPAVTGSAIIAITLRHASNVTVENTTISGLSANGAGLAAGIKDIYGDSAGLQIESNNISDASIGVQVEQGVVQDNWIHSEAPATGEVAGIESNGGSINPLTIRHNTVLTGANKNYAVGLFADFGPQVNRTVDNNLLAGGVYTIYAGQPSNGVASANIVVTNNRFSRAFYPKGGQYGPATAFNALGRGNVWSGNYWDDTLLPVPAP